MWRGIEPGGESFVPEFLILLLRAQKDYDLLLKPFRRDKIEQIDARIKVMEEMLKLAAPPKPKPTKAAETKCTLWLTEKVKLSVESGVVLKKADVRRDAKGRFRRLSDRGFYRVWDDCVPDEWKRGGRRPRENQGAAS